MSENLKSAVAVIANHCGAPKLLHHLRYWTDSTTEKALTLNRELERTDEDISRRMQGSVLER